MKVIKRSHIILSDKNVFLNNFSNQHDFKGEKIFTHILQKFFKKNKKSKNKQQQRNIQNTSFSWLIVFIFKTLYDKIVHQFFFLHHIQNI